MVQPAVRLARKRDLDSNGKPVTRQWRIDICVERLLKRFKTGEHHFAIGKAIIEAGAAHYCFIALRKSSGRVTRDCRVEKHGSSSTGLSLKMKEHHIVEIAAAESLRECRGGAGLK